MVLTKNSFLSRLKNRKTLRFELIGEQEIAGRKAFRIRFGPKKPHDITLAGEALIDEEDFQPASVYTRFLASCLWRCALCWKLMSRTRLQCSLSRLDKDIWFPDSFGTEFRLKAVFFIDRTITVSLENKNFKRTTAESQITYDQPH